MQSEIPTEFSQEAANKPVVCGRLIFTRLISKCAEVSPQVKKWKPVDMACVNDAIDQISSTPKLVQNRNDVAKGGPKLSLCQRQIVGSPNRESAREQIYSLFVDQQNGVSFRAIFSASAPSWLCLSMHCWKGTVLRRAESLQSSIYVHKILYIVE